MRIYELYANSANCELCECINFLFGYPPQPQDDCPQVPPQDPEPPQEPPEGRSAASATMSRSAVVALASVTINFPQTIFIQQENFISPSLVGVNSIIFLPGRKSFLIPNSGISIALVQPVTWSPLIIQRTGISFFI